MTNIFIGIRLPPEVVDALDATKVLSISLAPTVARIEKLEKEVAEMKKLLPKPC